ncbi:MAG: LuxR C-terminal-related transcriptional regulator [Oscillospiraceae bacterium]|nr:LuxR C-terminal-related transcriptional regulator [Oscillospiraceae bacterium]MCL2248347.1 LuxR C-terminal-related transcriptional regulator [Oscillospiraceae bacterium]
MDSFNRFRDRRIIFICAPAGYGKTVATTQWIGKSTRSKAVLSLDEYDNSPSVFLERFCAALRTCQSQNTTLADIVSHPSFQDAPEIFSFRAISALSTRKKALVAIDDLHLLHDDEVLQFLFTFIKRLPENFQIVLISRHDMPQKFSELWLKSHASRIGVEQLAFTDDEVMNLYNKQGIRITPGQASEIIAKTHGWAMGISAFLLSGGRADDSVYYHLDSFVRTNIWEKWENNVREFMLCTAMLRELNPSVCEAMAGFSNSESLLNELVQKGAFITQLQDGSYRYNHLFQEFLVRMAGERGEEFLYSLLETEGNWHLSQNNYSKAIDCFIRCKNHKGIGKTYIALVTSGNKDYALVRLLPIFNHPEVIAATKRYPHLLYVAASCAFFGGRVNDAISFMDEYYARYSEIVSEYPLLAYDIVLTRFWDFRIPLSEALKKAEEFPVPDFALTRSISMHMPLCHRGVIDFSEITSGDIDGALNTFFQKISCVSDEARFMNAKVVAAGLLYEQGNLMKAHEYAVSAVAEIKSHFPADSKFCAMSIMIYVLDALERENKESVTSAAEAATLVESISHMIEENKAYHLIHNFEALVTQRKISAGNVKAAEEWAKTHQNPTDPTLYGLYLDFTTCRTFIATGKYDLAIILLKKVLGIVKVCDRQPDILTAQILLAIAYWKKKQGFQNEALDYLESAVLTAYPFGYVQMFINEGGALSGMLYKLQKRVEQRKEEEKEHISFIKVLYLKTRSSAVSVYDSGKASVKFTDKQKAVMVLLCQGKTRREISESLGIKQPTLRTHLNSIYAKLEVSNVSDAVAKINSLRLLE